MLRSTLSTIVALALLAPPLAAQTVSSIAPAELRRGETVEVIVRGNGLGALTGATISGGDVTVSGFVATDTVARFLAGTPVSAPLGPRTLTLTGIAEPFEDALSVVPGAVTLLSVTPDTITRGEAELVTVSGTNLDTVSTWSFGAGIGWGNVQVTSPTRATIAVSVGALAAAGPRAVSATSRLGTATLPGALTIVPGTRTLTSVSPASIERGARLEVRIDGTNLDAVDDVSFGPRITVEDVRVVSAVDVRATVEVLESALAGPRDLIVRSGDDATVLPGALTVARGPIEVLALRPSTVRQGTTTRVYVDGRNLDGLTALDAGTGLDFTLVDTSDATIASVDLEVARDAAVGYRDVTAQGDGEQFTARDVLLVGEYQPPVLDIRVDDDVDLGDTMIGALRRRTIAFENAGPVRESLTIRAVDGDTAAFSIALPGEPAASEVSFALISGARADVVFEFRPHLRGRTGARFEVIARDGEIAAEVIVRGTGTRQTLDFSPPAPLEVDVEPGVELALPDIATVTSGDGTEPPVRVSEITVSALLDGEPFEPGDDVELTLDGGDGEEPLLWGDATLRVVATQPVGLLELEVLLATDAVQAPWMRYEIALDGRPDGGDTGGDVEDVGVDTGGVADTDLDTGSTDEPDTSEPDDVGQDTGDGGDDVRDADDGEVPGDGGGNGGCCAVAPHRAGGTLVLHALVLLGVLALRRRPNGVEQR
jgi:hypothetical protein